MSSNERLDNGLINDNTEICGDGCTGIEDEQNAGSEDIEEPFDPSKLRVDTKTLTIDLLVSRIERNEIDLNPEFQRKGGIWKDPVQSRLIESLIIAIPIPAFYFDATNEEKWLVVDGLQRLFTLKRFIVDEDLTLSGLEFVNDQEGKKFSGLPRKFQRRILETQVITYLIKEGTPGKVKFNIFKRINTGGLPLSTQEIRNALNPGNATKLLKKLAESDEFLNATDRSIRDERMADRECVLRFLAYTITPYTEYKIKDLDGFLNECMKKINEMSDTQLADLEQKFLRAMRIAYRVFGHYAFRKMIKIGGLVPRQPINKALFEAWSVTLNKLKDSDVELLEERKDELFEKYDKLLSEVEFFNAVSVGTDNVYKVKIRFKEIEDLIQEVLF